TQRKGAAVYLATGEEWTAVRVACIGLGAANHHRVQPVSIVEHVLLVLKQRRLKQAQQREKTEVVTLMRGRRQQQKIPAVAAQQLRQSIVVGLLDTVAAARRGQVLRLIEHDQVP